MVLKKIISGGQTGADQGGLVAGKALGLETGGTAPPDWQTAEGKKFFRLRNLGLVEGQPDSSIYKKRTRENVISSDATVWFGMEWSPGGKLTIGLCEKEGKPFLKNPVAAELRIWVEREGIETLNVAGSRESKNPGVFGRTVSTIWEAFADA